MAQWIKWLILGVFSIFFGVFILANPIAASVAVAIVAGAAFVLMGFGQLYLGRQADATSSRVIGYIWGGLMLLLGASLLFNPLGGVIPLAIAVTLIIGINGVARIFAAFQMKDTPVLWAMLLSGALSLFLAGYIFADFREFAPELLGILSGIEMLFNGASLISFAIFMRSNERQSASKDEMPTAS